MEEIVEGEQEQDETDDKRFEKFRLLLANTPFIIDEAVAEGYAEIAWHDKLLGKRAWKSLTQAVLEQLKAETMAENKRREERWSEEAAELRREEVLGEKVYAKACVNHGHKEAYQASNTEVNRLISLRVRVANCKDAVAAAREDYLRLLEQMERDYADAQA